MSDDLLAEIDKLQEEIGASTPEPKPEDKAKLKKKQAETKKKADEARAKNQAKKATDKAQQSTKPPKSNTKPVAKKASGKYDIESLPKKVQDKAHNAIAALETGKPLSRYTLIALEHLKSAKSFERKELIEVYISKGLKQSTANSQATQMRKLLPALGIATEDGSKLKANMSSEFLTSIG